MIKPPYILPVNESANRPTRVALALWRIVDAIGSVPTMVSLMRRARAGVYPVLPLKRSR